MVHGGGALRAEDGRSIRKALDWILEHAFGEGAWDYQNLTPIKPDSILPLLRRAAIAYEEPAYEKRLQELAGESWSADRTNLLYPAPGPADLPKTNLPDDKAQPSLRARTAEGGDS